MVHSRDDVHSKFQVIRTKGSQVIAVGSWAEKSGNFVDSPCTSLSRMPKSANRKRSRDHVACRSRDHGDGDVGTSPKKLDKKLQLNNS